MKRITKKFLVMLILIIVLASIFPISRSDAGRGTIEISDNGTVVVEEIGDLGERSIGANGVLFASDYSYEEYPKSYVHLIVRSDDMTENLAGFYAEIHFEGATLTGEIEERTGSWTVTEENFDYENNCVRFLVEQTDLESSYMIDPEVSIAYMKDVVSEDGRAWIDIDTFKKTDKYNNVYRSLSEVSEEIDGFSIQLLEKTGSLLQVVPQCENSR